MKHLMCIVLAVLGFSTHNFAQVKVPSEVQKAFNQQFPNASQVKWDKESKTEYEASFTMQGNKYSANFTAEGKWLETESEIQFDALPQAVQAAVQKKYKLTQIKLVAKIETAKGEVRYEVEIKHGLKTTELLYSTDGVEIKA